MYDKIILSGGSTRGYYQLGVLFKHEDDIQSVKRYVGTSVGALICLLLSCGFSVLEILRVSLQARCKLPEGKDLIRAARTFATKNGILTENPYIIELEKVLHKKYGYIPTLKQLYNITGKDVTLVTSCITTHSVVYMSHQSHPDMLCTVAADMSARIPIIFSPILYDSHLYVDGGLCDHFPIFNVDQGEHILAIYLSTNSAGVLHTSKHMGLMEYINALIETGLKTRYTDMNLSDTVTLYEICVDGPGINIDPIQAFIMFIIGCTKHPTYPMT